MGILKNQEAGESDFIDGRIEKKGYRKRWVRNVKKLPEHPFNNGIHMDTHHLISAEAVKLSKLGDVLIEKGYDINLLSNLVGFPATLPGACQLHCQLHRGDHIFSRPLEEPYHDYVSSQLTDPEIKKSIQECYGKTKKTEKASQIHKLLDPVSRKILKKVNKVRRAQFYELPLTKISHHFIPNGPGCCNKYDVNDAIGNKGLRCSKDRLHFKSDSCNGIDERYHGKVVRGNKKTIIFRSTRWIPEVGQ
ncbi:hypothetical protein HB761_20855 [Vibrio campbellii]|uniref:Uncharacterized protein n=1 Tax=Vibrio campbellii TaxID=680 RepID=A0AAE9N3M0_9VIBR|nr:AHH domain-containing protein [Vibrio campbellii]UTZ29098.1 hypothetical protein HB761_20855 [Vibrio campbellii]